MDAPTLQSVGNGSTLELLQTPTNSNRWEPITDKSDSTYVYNTTLGPKWDETYIEDVDAVTYTGDIEKVTVYARAKFETGPSAARLQVSLRTLGSGRDESSVQSLTTSWVLYSFEFAQNPSSATWQWSDFADLGGVPTSSSLQVGVGLDLTGTGPIGPKVQCSDLYIVVTHDGITTTLTASAIGLSTPAFTQAFNFGRNLTAQVGLAASITRATTYGRVMTVAMGLRTTLIREVDLAVWLVVGSSTDGTTRTRVGSSWAAAAKTASITPLPGAWLAQFDNRLVALKAENSGLSYSPVNDLVSNWTNKPNFPNLPISFTGMFDGKDTSDNPALFFIAHDGVYFLDVFSNFVFGKTELSWESDITSGKKGMYFRGVTYVLTGKGIFQLVGGIATEIGPDTDDGLPDDIAAPIADMIGVGYWLVIAINGGAGRKSVIMKRHINGKHWHTVYKTAAANSEIQTLFWADGILYFGEGTNVKSLQMSNTNDNVKLTPDHTVQSTGALIYPWFHSPFEATPKLAVKARMVSEDMTATEKVTLFYRIDAETTFTSLGTYTTSPRPTPLSFGTAKIGVPFERIQFKTVPVRDSTTTNRPVVISLTLDYIVKPDIIYKWRFKAHAVTTTERKGSDTIDALAVSVAKTELQVFYPSGDKSKTSYLVEVTGMPRVQKGTEFGEEGDYDVEVSMVTEE